MARLAGRRGHRGPYSDQVTEETLFRSETPYPVYLGTVDVFTPPLT